MHSNDWLHELPQGWEKRFLKHKLKKITDGAHVSPDTSVRKYPFVSTVNIKNGVIDFESCLKTSPKSYRVLSSQGCQPEKRDVLFSKDGTVGKTVLISYEKEFVVASSLIILTPVISGVNPAFLNFMLQSHFILEQIKSFVKGSAIKRVSLLNIKKIIGFFPPIKEQLRISIYLEQICKRINTTITLKKQQLNTLEALRKSIIHKAVTQGLDDSVEMKDSCVDWLGEIPKHWKAVKLKRIAVLQSGLTLGKQYSGNLVKRSYLRVSNVQDGYLDLKKVSVISLPEKTARGTELQKGDVLMTEGGDLDKLGRGFLWEGQIQGCLHQNHVFAIRPKTHKLSASFLTFITSSNYGRAYFEATGKKTTNLASTNASKIKAFYIPLPSVEEQEKIVAHLKSKTTQIENLKKNIQKQIETLEQYRKSIIHECVTGKRRVT